MGPIADISLWLWFRVSGAFAVFGMYIALKAFTKAIK
jgi:hypothetical protein